MATILVVDDEQITRQLLQKLLEKRGYTCLTAQSAAEARQALEETAVDLLVTDVMMPKETGLDLVRYLLPKYPDMAVVMVTAVESELFSELAHSEGVYDYIQKPFEPEDLLERVASALRRRKMKMAKVSYDGSMSIGLLREAAAGEQRVALLPDAVALLVAKGHKVYFQKECGAASGHPDEDYRLAGGTPVEASQPLIETAQLVVKVNDPTLEEVETLKPEQMLMSFFKAEASPHIIDILLDKKIATLALQRIGTDDSPYLVLSPQSTSQSLSLQVYPLVEKIAELGIYAALDNHLDLRNGLITILGQLTCQQTAKALNRPWLSYESILDADRPNEVPAL